MIYRFQEHKADYESLQEKKKEGSDKVVGLYRRRELVHKELKQCKELVKEANLYQRYCDDLRDIKMHKALFDVFHLERRMETHAKDAEECAHTLKKLETECGVLEKQMKITGREKAEKQKEWAVHDQKAQDIEKEIKKIQRNDIIKVETSIKSSKADLDQSKDEIEKASAKKKEASKQLKVDQSALSEHEKDLQAYENESGVKDIQLQGNQVSQYNQLKMKADSETQKAREAYEFTSRQHSLLQHRLNDKKTELERVQARIEEREKQVQDDSGDKEGLTKAYSTMQTTKQKLESDLKDLESKHRQEVQHRQVRISNPV